jgi:CheY-like chemotaxis protein
LEQALNKTLRILIVDDHPTNRRLPATLLRQHGWEVDVAADGETALDKLAIAHFDAVLLDLNMPDVSGFEVCRRIRADELLRHVRIYAYTSMTMMEDKMHSAGFDGLLAKPLSAEKLIAMLEGKIHGSSAS